MQENFFFLSLKLFIKPLKSIWNFGKCVLILFNFYVIYLRFLQNIFALNLAGTSNLNHDVGNETKMEFPNMSNAFFDSINSGFVPELPNQRNRSASSNRYIFNNVKTLEIILSSVQTFLKFQKLFHCSLKIIFTFFSTVFSIWKLSKHIKK